MRGVGLIEGPVWLGVMHLQLQVLGAQSLKDRRRVVLSVRDKVRARFDVSVHEVTASEAHTRAAVLITTGGSDSATIASTLDKIRALVESRPDCVVAHVEREVRAWPDPRRWINEEDAENV